MTINQIKHSEILINQDTWRYCSLCAQEYAHDIPSGFHLRGAQGQGSFGPHPPARPARLPPKIKMKCMHNYYVLDAIFNVNVNDGKMETPKHRSHGFRSHYNYSLDQ